MFFFIYFHSSLSPLIRIFEPTTKVTIYIAVELSKPLILLSFEDRSNIIFKTIEPS
jgi:hypothetical protein